MGKNRKLRLFVYGICVLSLAWLWRCRAGKTWHKATFLYFDTVCEVNLFCSPPDFASARTEINRIFSEIEKEFSPGAAPTFSLHTRTLFQKAWAVWENSQGCFDITVAPLADLWGFRAHKPEVPPLESIQEVMSQIGMEKIKLPPPATQEEDFRIPDKMGLDWGGIAKGYGIDLTAHALINKGFQRGFINAGGDLYCWGSNPDHKAWQIGIKHPRQEGFLGVLSLSDTGVATTGDYQRYFVENGIRYHHIFDPKTGFPARGKQSITVIGPETCLCDALATALFVSKTPEEILKLYPSYGAILVNEEGEIYFLGKSFPFRLID